MRPRLGRRPDLGVRRGERLLAWASAADGTTIGGTRDALYVDGARIPWEQVEAAAWERDSSELRVSEVGTWGRERPEHRIVVDEPGRLLELVRERVTATVVLQRHVPIEGRLGVRVIARRAPSGARELSWLFEYDDGVDPDDPHVRAAATAALLGAQGEVGEV